MGGIWKKRIKEEQKEQRSNHFLNFRKSIRTWHLILVLIPILFLTATFLRFDHLKMNELKAAVVEADLAGEDENGQVPEGTTQKTQEEITADITEKMKALKEFTESHTIVNFIEKNGITNLTFGTGPIYLEHQYNRLAAIAINKAKEIAVTITDENPNGNIYAKANAVCQPLAIKNRWSWNSPGFLNCMTTEIAKYPASDYITEQIAATIPSTALFRYDFASPVWAPTIAGALMIVAALLVIIIIYRIITWILIRIALLIIK